MEEKEKLEALLDDLSRKMKEATQNIEKTDVELEWLQEVQINDTVLDTIRTHEVKLEEIQADRNALWQHYKVLSKKLKNL